MQSSDLVDQYARLWESNLRAGTWDAIVTDAKSCPLCQVYLDRWGKDPCNGCPIRIKTGQPYCKGTPYSDAFGAKLDWGQAVLVDRVDPEPYRKEAMRQARRMIEFLRSL